MCMKCLVKALAGLKDEPVGKAGTQALKLMQEAVFEKERFSKLVKAEVDQAIEVIRVKHEETYNAIEKRRAAAWDLVKTQLGLDPNSECEIDTDTGQVTQTVKV
jgi:hypothetical protein